MFAARKMIFNPVFLILNHETLIRASLDSSRGKIGIPAIQPPTGVNFCPSFDPLGSYYFHVRPVSTQGKSSP